jgi:hypothetical protein
MSNLEEHPSSPTPHHSGTGPPIARRTRGLRLVPDAPLRRARPVPPVIDYPRLVRELKHHYKISIRKWRAHLSGVSYELTYRDGRIKRLIAAPRPRSPVSAAIFLHEVGHHAIGFRRYASRCLEEHYVWQWTFREMESRGIPITHRVMRHFRRSMYHYVKRSHQRREHVPPELAHFAHWPG